MPSSIPREYAKVMARWSGVFPVPVIDIASDLGISIYETKDMESTELGVIRKEGENFVIYVNADQPPTRKMFTIAHEIGHYMAHHDFLESGNEHMDEIEQFVGKIALKRDHAQTLNPERRGMETEANKIAADILMPENEFRQIWQSKAETEGVEAIARYFGVSVSAASVRAINVLGVIIP